MAAGNLRRRPQRAPHHRGARRPRASWRVALGEAVVAVGTGASGLRLNAGVVGAALLGMTVIACLWWAYFDWIVYVAGDHLEASTGTDRATLARDAYAYLHSAMVGGIVLFAYGVETALHNTSTPLDAIPATALAGGVAIYFLAHVGLPPLPASRSSLSPRPSTPSRRWLRSQRYASHSSATK